MCWEVGFHDRMQVRDGSGNCLILLDTNKSMGREKQRTMYMQRPRNIKLEVYNSTSKIKISYNSISS